MFDITRLTKREKEIFNEGYLRGNHASFSRGYDEGHYAGRRQSASDEAELEKFRRQLVQKQGEEGEEGVFG